ncbi:sensor histidine kinase [Kutzneria buriramensis]|uniref:histidine kinase n=1 Tax=Kutzneria buriramensis TaxID=1045776 RepID=A0A3E0I037_9PSEU|nr:histidine kinase [Kutzneria buriramensis]REH51565.1 signal transduction histidine kinase [Kutzneria buriramensis]
MRYLWALCWLAGAALLVTLGIVDYLAGTIRSDQLGMLQLGSGMLACLVALVGPALGPAMLPLVALVPAGTSLAATFLGATSADHRAPLAFAATASLCWLIALIAWRARTVLAAITVPVLTAAIVLQPLWAQGSGITTIAALALPLLVLVAIAAGVSARLVGLNRARQADAIRLAQRAEFARDLHDYVGHHVTGIVLLAQGARAMADKQPELVLPALERIEQAGTEAMATMRRMVGLLRDADAAADFSPLATIADVQELVTEFGPTARLELDGDFDGLPAEIQSTVHRVVMESLTNVRKHSDGARDVRVLVSRAAKWINVGVADDGRGRHGGRAGFGLRGLTERVTALGGSIKAGPRAAGGWMVEASLPVERD